MSEWEITRHQVAIAGRVTDAVTGRPIPGATVSVATLSGEVELTTAPDGHFHLLDLADGTYELVASKPGGYFGRATRQVTVTRNEAGRILMATADMNLPIVQ